MGAAGLLLRLGGERYILISVYGRRRCRGTMRGLSGWRAEASHSVQLFKAASSERTASPVYRARVSRHIFRHSRGRHRSGTELDRGRGCIALLRARFDVCDCGQETIMSTSGANAVIGQDGIQAGRGFGRRTEGTSQELDRQTDECSTMHNRKASLHIVTSLHRFTFN